MASRDSIGRDQPGTEPAHLRKVAVLPREEREISAVAVSPDPDLIAYATDRLKRSKLVQRFSFSDKALEAETTIKIWNRRTAEIQTVLQDRESHAFGSLFFTPDGRSLLMQSGFSTHYSKLWDLSGGQPRFAIEQEGDGWLVRKISPDGKLLSMANQDGTVRLWSLANGAGKMTINEYVAKEGSRLQRWAYPEKYDKPYWFTMIYFSPDSRLLGIATRANQSEVWDLTSGRLRYTLDGSDRSSDWATNDSDFFSPDGRITATTFNHRDSSGQTTANGVKLSLATDGSLLRVLDHATSPVRFSPDGKKLATGLVHLKNDGTKEVMAEIWNVETGDLVARLIDPENDLDEMWWSPDGRTLATASGSTYTLTLWDAKAGNARARIRLVRHHGFDFISDYISDQDRIFFSPDSRFLIAANQKSFRIIETGSGTVLEKIDRFDYQGFLSNGQLLSLSADRKSVVICEIIG